MILVVITSNKNLFYREAGGPLQEMWSITVHTTPHKDKRSKIPNPLQQIQNKSQDGKVP